MKYLLIIILFAAPVFGQCVATADDPCLSVNASLLAKANRAADELLAARDAITKLSALKDADKATIDAAKGAVELLQRALTTSVAIEEQYKGVVAMLKEVVVLQQGIIDRLTNQLNKPRSTWKRFLDAIKTVLVFAVGVKLGGVL